MDGAGHFKNGHLAKFFSDIESEYNIATDWNHFTSTTENHCMIPIFYYHTMDQTDSPIKRIY